MIESDLPPVDEELLLRMSRPGPRYTSYPTAPVWRDDLGDADARAALRRAAEHPDEPLSLYVHIPFCRRRCLFCGCTVEITRREDRVERYLDALEREIDMVSGELGGRRSVVQLHFGGGTPTHLSPTELRRVFERLRGSFRIETGAELSIEVHPHVTHLEHVETLAELGFNRISMGVQDTDAHVQAVVHRDQTVEETARLVERCRELGFLGINMDLMYGLPAQTEETFARTLGTVVGMRPDRLAVYGYAHVPWLKPTQKVLEREHLPDPVERAHLFAVAIHELSSAGYRVIGLDHFARETDALYESLLAGTMHRNFMGYTTHPAEDMVAFGMSSISDVGGAFLQNARQNKDYERLVAAEEIPAVRGMVRSPEDDLRRAVIQELMCRMELDLDRLEARFERCDLEEHFREEWKELEPLAREGFCDLEERRVRVLPRGRLFLRHLAMVFDAYLEPRPGEHRFSQTI